jgi:hypothetical protein
MTIPVNPGTGSTDNLDEILDRCLRAIERNRATIEACAARFPEYPELADLLRTAVTLRGFSSVEMPAAFTARTQQQLQAQLRKSVRANRAAPSGWDLLFRFAAVLAVVIILFTAGGFGLVRASVSALPGDTLYGLKRYVEQTELAYASPQTQAAVLNHIADTRLDEVNALVSKNRTIPESFLLELSQSVNSALIYVDKNQRKDLIDKTLSTLNFAKSNGAISTSAAEQTLQRLAIGPSDYPTPPAVTANATATDTPTNTPTATPTDTDTPTYTPTATATTAIPAITATEVEVMMPTATATPSLTSTAEDTATWTPTRHSATPSKATVTRTPTATATSTPTPSGTASPTELFTTADVRPMDTNTPVGAAAAAITATETPVPPTLTDTETATRTPSATRTPTKTKTPTRTPTPTFTATPTSTSTLTPTSTLTWTPLPDIPGLPMGGKQQPQSGTVDNCPAEGESGDAALNRLANRTDQGGYQGVPFDVIAGLPWPADALHKTRDQWTPADVNDVNRAEGVPVTIEGYIVQVQQRGADAANCHANDKTNWQILITSSPDSNDLSKAVVVVMTPRVRHPGWTLDKLNALATSKAKINASGWLLFNNEADDVGSGRSTPYEIRPVMDFTVFKDGQPVKLDDYQP